MSYGHDFAVDSRYEREDAIASERATFIRRTYSHLAGAILAFIGLEFFLLSIPGIEQFVFNFMFAGGSPVGILVVFGLFIVAGYVAQSWAMHAHNPGLAYAGLSLYVVTEAVIFLPIMIFASRFDPNIIATAGILTLAVFGGLTLTVFVTKKDFSFLGPILSIASFIALGVIIAAIVVGGFSLGMFFTVAMIVLMAGYILYYTSNVLLHFDPSMHVAASLALFAAVATMFWYVLRLLLILASDR